MSKKHFRLLFPRTARQSLYQLCLAYAMTGCDTQNHAVITNSLETAIRTGNLKDVKKLLDKKDIKANTVTKHGKTPLVVAAEHGHEDMVRFFLKEYSQKPSKDDIKKALDAAKTEEIKQLLKQELGNEASPAVVDVDADLRDAALNNHTDAIKKLLENGAKVDGIDKHGKTALMIAAENGCKEGVELLLANGANANAIDEDGKMTLIFAAEKGNKEIVHGLLEKGSDVNAKSNVDITALMSAAWHGHSEIAQILLNKGATANAANKEGYTALMMAAEKEHMETVKCLLSHTTKPSNDEINKALTVTKTENIKLLLQQAIKGKPRKSNKMDNETNPETENQNPETENQNPETENQNPETENQNPETENQNPETENPETENPETENPEPKQSGEAKQPEEAKQSGEAKQPEEAKQPGE